MTNLPRGNAEMELMGLLPIYYVYHYLEKTEKWDILGKESAASERELKRKMQAGGMFVSVEQNKNCRMIIVFPPHISCISCFLF